ncbi:MAG TPA: glycoside hydrolase family 2 TIM barrel-domain containing protein, partial [Bacteroidota bacterium]|nr:glycoside hydrolase family 2 TIM barrel-domain containing protein [Bacteroidota bacterium]
MPTDLQQRGYLHTGSAIRILPLLLTIPLTLSSSSFAQYRFLENGNPTLRGSDAGFLLDTPTRRKIDLSGSWDYSLPGGPSGTVRVPCAFDFRGTVAFQRSFELTKEEIDQYRFHLVSLGVNYGCETTVNGEFVGSHLGGYTSTMEPIPRDILQVGRENTIRLTVTNELDPRATLPIRSAPWGVRSYGGITRDVYLLETPPLFIRDASFASELSASGESAKLTVHASVEGSDSLTQPDMPVGTKTLGPFFSFEIVEKVSGLSIARSPAVPMTRKGNDWDEVKSELQMQNPKLWSPDNPDLYLVKCYLTRPEGKDLHVIDEYDLTAGIRKIAISGGHILLNGNRLSLRGVTWYEDHPAWGSSIPDEERERDVVMMKTLGANLVRFIDHPPHPYMLNLCDRYGLLAMEELPLEGTPGPLLASDSYGDLASAMLREMILRDRNHPCVMAWGMGDELD